MNTKYEMVTVKNHKKDTLVYVSISEYEIETAVNKYLETLKRYERDEKFIEVLLTA